MTTATAPRVSRPSFMGRGLGKLVGTETRMFLREPGAMFFSLAFPSVLLLGVGFLIPGLRDPITEPGPMQGMQGVVYMLPSVLAAAIAAPALTTLPVSIAGYREQGVLKRLSTTPMRPQGLLVAHVVLGVACFLVAAAVAVALAMLAFDVPAPRQLGTVLLGAVLAAAATFGVGLVIAAVAPRGNAAQGMGMLLYFPMLFLAGLWTPGPVMPDVVESIATWTPLGAASQAFEDGWFTGDFPVVQLLVMAAYVAVLYPIAAKLFRWS
ncbi:ABC transporter permease [Georgenia alba]|uniref:Transport permease protein n=1 Tax=Georgenia alba TaxID=2233858 RepID=A0ABW2Q765_9MICO